MLYKNFVSRGIDVLYDDRDVRAGEKFADADLIGISTQVIIGDEALNSKMLEVKDRKSGETRKADLDSLIEELILPAHLEATKR